MKETKNKNRIDDDDDDGSEYWVSNERKFCDFCKCWIADNKPSISFHEGGKRHKLNVAKRITEISKQSAKDERAQQKVDSQIRQMEDAAMRAYAADISRGADMTSQAINAFAAIAQSTEKPEQERVVEVTNNSTPGPSSLPRRAIDPLMPPVDIMEEEEKAKREKMRKKAEGSSWTVDEGGAGSMWCEAKSDEGHTYYWNVKTNDTRWTAPKEGYMTIEEYNRISNVAEAQKLMQQHKDSMFMRGNADEIVAKYKREKLKERRPKPNTEEIQKEIEEKESYKPYEEPGWSAKPLGQWTTVSQREQPHVDLQLPEVKNDYVYVPAAHVAPEPPVKKFKEKTIGSLAAYDNEDIKFGATTSFKKRKVGVKRNVRERVEDD